MTTTSTTTTTLVQVVAEYCQLKEVAESKFFPLTEQAIDMFEHGLKASQVSKEFRLAFAEANFIEAGGLMKRPQYRDFRKRVCDIVTIAKCGRQFYEEHKAQKTGFYRMVELAKPPKVGKPPLAAEQLETLIDKISIKLAVLIDSKGTLPRDALAQLANNISEALQQ